MMVNEELLQVERVRHPIVVRTLQVSHIEHLNPNYVRMRLSGPDLAGFISAGFDDHVKLFFAENGHELVKPEVGENGVSYPEGSVKPAARDYTPRYYNATEGYLEVDFVLHDEGPAGLWATQAQLGDELTLVGPRGSMIIPTAYSWHLLVGDETALPAISRRLTELPDHVIPMVVLELDDSALAQHLPEHPLAQVQVVAHSPQGELLTQAVAALQLPDGLGYAWAAAESTVVKNVREVLVEIHGLNNKQVKASSYWRAATSEAA